MARAADWFDQWQRECSGANAKSSRDLLSHVGADGDTECVSVLFAAETHPSATELLVHIWTVVSHNSCNIFHPSGSTPSCVARSNSLPRGSPGDTVPPVLNLCLDPMVHLVFESKFWHRIRSSHQRLVQTSFCPSGGVFYTGLHRRALVHLRTYESRRTLVRCCPIRME